jgi:pilus assembly protein Flp/PilA
MIRKGLFNMLRSLVTTCLNLRSDKRAVTAIEYALIAALIAIVIIGAVTTLGVGATTTFNNVAIKL